MLQKELLTKHSLLSCSITILNNLYNMNLLLLLLFRQKLGDICSSPGGPTIVHSPQRTGCMAAFDTFKTFENYFDEILDLLEDFANPAVISPKIMEAVESTSESQHSTSINVSLTIGDGTRTPGTLDENNIKVTTYFIRWPR